MTGDPSWWNQIRETVGQGVSEVGKRVSIESLARSVSGWFRVDEAEVQEILRQVRAELPTTEALLVGKPQSGKSSIVRSLTGVSAEIVGQGFRPHTQYTQQYSYPTQELPLLVFTDTVGLGDGMQETSEVIRELIGELQPDQTRAKVLILTVKISDFATDTLKQIASQIRAKHSEVPCLLAVTCLHELYPAEVSDHPDYPPSFANVDRAFSTIQQNFAGLFDRAVLIDFSLEEDEFHPPFYGLEAFIEALSELLPEAEARTIAQLLNDRDEGKQIGELYRDAGRRYILPFSVMAGAVAAIPIPLATMPVLTALQVSMVGALGQLYGQTLTPSQAGGVVSAIAGGFVAQAIGRELIKFVPGFGSVIAASWASAYTWALGEAACVYFGDLLGGKNPDPQRIQAAMKESFQLAKERFKRP
ncbi:GTPase [Leptolyngbya sp. FACHB-17]|uniref:YcjF family protein n=1 Tax=unclassified Leptolyngbya TaxID=2650499 RepID=UPI00167FE661|nr:GTPase [Leptolyngbya sp. FACHB-17]MBD2081558.1 50S ribosome-binding GTPase [Leptolyngbya sp. FACHB-17]